ncbi:MAG: response regulator transcription factor [Anaerolineae bacterium]|nr:response regulator transcription factor [Anaerolineae bacterium]
MNNEQSSLKRRESVDLKPLVVYLETLLVLLKEAVGEEVDSGSGPIAAGLTSGLEAQPALPIEALTDREVEVLHQLSTGDSYKEIARTLAISLNTVKTHLKRIYDKLDVSGRREAVKKARRLGYFDQPRCG